MQSIDFQVVSRMVQWMEQGTVVWLCTIVATYGSSPRPVGAMLAADGKGVHKGSLSGGCVEEDFLARLAAGRFTAPVQLVEYGKTRQERERFKLPCGGSILLLVERLAPVDRNRIGFATILEAIEKREPIAREINHKNGRWTLNKNDDPGPTIERRGDTIVHRFAHAQELVLIGASLVAEYVAQIAFMMDYKVSVCDPRREMIERWPVPGIARYCEMPDDFIAHQPNHRQCAILALAHDPRIDDMGLMEALETDAFYIGALGSQRTSRTRIERLRCVVEDLDGSKLARLHAPVGLNIGSKTPAEIAVAIMADVTRVKNGISETNRDPVASRAYSK